MVLPYVAVAVRDGALATWESPTYCVAIDGEMPRALTVTAVDDHQEGEAGRLVDIRVAMRCLQTMVAFLTTLGGSP